MRRILGNHPYFEGWYFKLQRGEETVAFIPGISRDGKGEEKAFIQVIAAGESYNVDFPLNTFSVSASPFTVRIGENVFSTRGIRCVLPELNCAAAVLFGRQTPLRYDAMGPFRFVPGMECRHGVVSLYHPILDGLLVLGGKRLNMGGGTGYIETDRGRSFPENYLWVQSNDFPQKACVMVSIASIPFAGTQFKGCIGLVHTGGKEYRLATYTGVKIVSDASWYVHLRQRELDLEILPESRAPQKLFAPDSGRMKRIIHEDASCPVRFRFRRGDRILLDHESRNASFEFVRKGQEKFALPC